MKSLLASLFALFLAAAALTAQASVANASGAAPLQASFPAADDDKDKDKDDKKKD